MKCKTCNRLYKEIGGIKRNVFQPFEIYVCAKCGQYHLVEVIDSDGSVGINPVSNDYGVIDEKISEGMYFIYN